jgi:hypothetical protein
MPQEKYERYKQCRSNGSGIAESSYECELFLNNDWVQFKTRFKCCTGIELYILLYSLFYCNTELQYTFTVNRNDDSRRLLAVGV